MKKKILYLIPLLLLLCSSSIASAMTTEESAGVDGLGLFTYTQRFSDLSGGLIVTTTSVNNSGIMEAYVTTTVLCMNASRNFRLRVYDSDVKMFIETNNENGIGEKQRKFKVRTHMDTETLLWTAFVTDLTAELIFAQISLYYTYDEDAEWIPPGEEEEGISQEDYEAEQKRLRRQAWRWGLQGSIGTLAGVFVGIRFIKRIYGAN